MTRTRAIAADTRPAGMGLPGLWPASRGASTTSLSEPIDACRAVIAIPRRTAVDGSAPATVATATTTRPSSRDGNGWVRRIRPPARAAAGGPSDVDDLVEVLGQVLDQAVSPIGHLRPDPWNEGVQRRRRDHEPALRIPPDRRRRTTARSE